MPVESRQMDAKLPIININYAKKRERNIVESAVFVYPFVCLQLRFPTEKHSAARVAVYKKRPFVRRAKEGVRRKLPLQYPPEECIYKREASTTVELEAITRRSAWRQEAKGTFGWYYIYWHAHFFQVIIQITWMCVLINIIMCVSINLLTILRNNIGKKRKSENIDEIHMKVKYSKAWATS